MNEPRQKISSAMYDWDIGHSPYDETLTPCSAGHVFERERYEVICVLLPNSTALKIFLVSPLQ